MSTPAGPDGAAATRDLVESLPAVIWEADPDASRMTYVSPRSLELLGYPPEQWLASPSFWDDHVHPDDRAAATAAVDRAAADGGTTQIRYRFRRADDTWAWFQDAVSVTRREDGTRRMGGVMIPIEGDADAAAPAQAAPSEARLATAAVETLGPVGGIHRALVDNLGDGVYYVDRQRKITYWNHGAEHLTGFDADAVVGRRCNDNLLDHVDERGKNLCTSNCPLLATIHDGKQREKVVWLRHADGSRRPVNVRTAPIRDGDDGAILGAVEVFSDATGLVEARSAAETARRDALTDPLTGLPSRRLLDSIIAARQDDLNRHGLPYGFLLADLDGLGAVNARFGASTGDNALRVAGATLKGGLRMGDTLVRWEGGRFAVVGAQVDVRALHRLADRVLVLMRAAEAPVPGGRIPVRVSIGGALAHPHEPVEQLLARAETALAVAKAGGRDRFSLNEPMPVHRKPRVLGVRSAESPDGARPWQ